MKLRGSCTSKQGVHYKFLEDEVYEMLGYDEWSDSKIWETLGYLQELDFDFITWKQKKSLFGI